MRQGAPPERSAGLLCAAGYDGAVAGWALLYSGSPLSSARSRDAVTTRVLRRRRSTRHKNSPRRASSYPFARENPNALEASSTLPVPSQVAWMLVGLCRAPISAYAEMLHRRPGGEHACPGPLRERGDAPMFAAATGKVIGPAPHSRRCAAISDHHVLKQHRAPSDRKSWDLGIPVGVPAHWALAREKSDPSVRPVLCRSPVRGVLLPGC